MTGRPDQAMRSVDSQALESAADPAGRLLRQVHYERALAQCSRALLASALDALEQQAVLTSALAPLMEAAQADRAYLFRNFRDDEAGLCMDMLAEVCAPGIRPQIQAPANHRFPWSSCPADSRPPCR